MWNLCSNEDSDRYTWYDPTGTCFRIDYAFVSSKLATTLDDVSTNHDRHFIKLNFETSTHINYNILWGV